MTALRPNALWAMEQLPRGGRGAEVGTHRGRWTQGLRDVAAPAELTLIDPWAEDPGRDGRALAYAADQARRDADHAAVAAAFPEATIRRAASAEVLPTLGDAALDWLFLDGEKQYDVLLSDLEQAARIVRPGGVVAGGGWHWGRELGWPVRAALRDVAARIDGARIDRRGMFWTLRLPDRVTLAPRPPRRGHLIVSTMKNEAPYLVDWIAHHRAVGFDGFLVYTNDCEDGTDRLLARMQSLGGVTHVANTVLRRGPHKSALKWARDHVATARAEWILISDADEFLNPCGHGTVQGLLRALGPETDVVSFPWKVFGNSGVGAFADRPVPAQFTACEPEPRRGGRRGREVKTMFRRLDAMHHLGLHRPRVAPAWRDRIVWRAPDGRDLSDRMNDGQGWTMPWAGCGDAGYMHHYPLRSREAYILKKNRGRANHVSEDLGLDYWRKWDLTGGRDRSLAEGAPGFAEGRAALMADRQVRRLHREAVAWHRAEFARLMTQPRFRALWDELDGRTAA